MYRNRNKGFTLIELLVAIAIIGLLSSVIMATLAESRRKAEYKKFQSEIVETRNAIQLYAADHDGDYPGSGSDTLSGHDDILGMLESEGYLTSAIELPDYITESYIIDTEWLVEMMLDEPVICGSSDYYTGYLLLYRSVVDLSAEAGLEPGGGILGIYWCLAQA